MIELKQPKERKVVPEVTVYLTAESVKSSKDLHLMDGNGVFDASRYAYSISTYNDIEGVLATAKLSFTSAIAPAGLNIGHSQFMNLMKVKLAVGSLITIKIDSKSIKPDFLGVIDHLYESKTADGSSVGRTVNINCSLLLPKMLVKDSLPNSPVLMLDKKLGEVLGEERIKFFEMMRGSQLKDFPFAGRPINGVKYVLKQTPGTNIINSSLKKTVAEIIDNETQYVDKDKDGKDIKKPVFDFRMLTTEWLFDPSLSVFFGTIYEYIKKMLDTYFYEMFFDTVVGEKGEVYNSMTIRTKPFTYGDIDKKWSSNWQHWEAIDTIRFNSKYRTREELGTNDFDIRNFIHTTYTQSLIANPQSTIGLFGVMYPILNLESIQKYGLRELGVTSTNMNIKQMTEDKKKAIEDQAKTQGKATLTLTDEDMNWLLEKRDKVFYWNCCNEILESGRITALGNSEYRIGRKLFYEDKEYYYPYDDFVDADGKPQQKFTGVEYYIKSVGHAWTYGAEWFTNLGLTRGQAIGVIKKHIEALEKKTMKTGQKVIYKINKMGKDNTPTPLETASERQLTADEFNKFIKQPWTFD